MKLKEMLMAILLTDQKLSFLENNVRVRAKSILNLSFLLLSQGL